MAKIEQFVTAITAKARHRGYTTSCTMKKGETLMNKILLAVVAALAVAVGALAVTAGDDRSSTPTMTTLPLLF